MTQPDPAEIRAAARRNLFPHFTRAEAWRSPDLPVIDHGEGCYVYDDSGRRYLDGLSGLFCVNIGHGRTDIVAAAMKQMEKLAYWPNWGAAHPSAIEAAARIAELTPGDLDRIFFVNSGSEAVESALKFARQYHRSQGQPERTVIIARDMAYHGVSMGALALTGIPWYKEPFEPVMPDVRHFPHTLGEVVPDGGSAAGLPSITRLKSLIDEVGPERIAAIFAEPVQNSRGALVPPAGYWQELRKICDQHGILLVADEVICGFGRLGAWFGSTRFEVVPDVITFAKAATSGYAPLGGMAVRTPLVEQLWDSPDGGSFFHGSTWGGHPVATAAAVANIDAMIEMNAVGNARDHEPQFKTGLDSLLDSHPTIADVRGTGYFYAIEFTADRRSGRPLTTDQAQQLVRGVMPTAMREAGLLTRPDDRGATMLILAPPLIADAAILDELINQVDQVAAAVDSFIAAR
ncbi:aspartate aminotransferase family protein [Microlunatus elymi]|uniref:Aspartate aminotransferase family protein n=1 Tax=Microlunatus elymi TaxID=2596828 RepID=A0A516PVP5_9ACTN|nr:aspartate aminotransferase family protein [Microlunatus elymi]QDP95021.1 aspartate aminotransferase family protein [Microlunatus elymi]